MDASPRGTTIDTIQALRFLAALIVVLDHARFFFVGDHVPGGDSLTFPYFAGRFGVDIFFILSGFVMVYISGDRDSWRVSPGCFILDRAIRVIPLYWLTTTAYTVLLALSAKGAGISVAELAKSFSFIPYQNRAYLNIQPVLSQGWTLNYEIFFYFIFSLFINFSKSKLLMNISLLFLCLIVVGFLCDYRNGRAISIIGHGVIEPWVFPRFYFSPIILQFWVGVVIGTVFQSRCFATAKLKGGFWASFVCSIVLIIIATVMFNALDQKTVLIEILQSVLAMATVISAILFSSPFARDPVARVLSRLGNASYSLYLVHFLILFVAIWVWKHLLKSDMSPEIFTLVATGICCLAALGSYTWIERPMTEKLHEFRRHHAKLLRSGRDAQALGLASGRRRPVATQVDEASKVAEQQAIGVIEALTHADPKIQSR